MMAYPHITISHDLDQKVREYAMIKNLKYSHAVSELINYGFNSINENKNSEVNITLLEKILSKEKYITILLEQLYSDMYMEAKTNPKDNAGLKTIKNKLFGKDFYD